MTRDSDVARDAVQDPLTAAIAKQEELLRSMQDAHGEFHPNVSDDLAQLAMLHNMRGDHDRALPLLHKRLVIHEKHGPPERVGETLHELGTTYRLQGLPDLAQQHLERALSTRTASHGDKSFKVAETLNSLALLHQTRSANDKAEALQLQSLQVLLESDEPVDIESEDVPWEVYKRLKQQRGPSTAANSLTLLKGTMRKCVADALEAKVDVSREVSASSQPQRVAFFGATATTGTVPVPMRPPSSPHALSIAGRTARSQSESAILHLRMARDATEDFEARLSASEQLLDDEDDTGVGDDTGDHRHQRMTPARQVTPPLLRLHLSPVPSLRRQPSPPLSSLDTTGAAPAVAAVLSSRVSEPIQDTATLLARVESIKRRVVAGASGMDMEIARLTADVERLPAASELRQLGESVLGLVREMHRMRVRADGDSKQMPVLEGHLDKKSASIFRGFERRFFKVDPKTFILSYHFSQDDYTRGFAPRGGFPVARISKITVHRHPTRGSGVGPGPVVANSGWFHFDVVVDLSTRHNPHASRTYELRAESADVRRYWVETLQFYKIAAHSTALSSPVGRPGTS